ncbi:SRPBCC family protein [Jeongeupia naejangsanensis]|uniref:SRPBCC family protein n=1 Tax=Jeongeupia naejangsanensis TaxID=613195 RepID=A0ABS2BIJ6_9NEIS|nr:SRPBCC family protein [Jeongeupia naejangsanensis]MBM3115419.1 SRPBCC family protein [Jeongeupia naejangsanensis]
MRSGWWLVLCWPLVALAQPDPIRADVVRHGDIVMLSVEFTVAVPQALAWEVMVDFDHMPAFLPQLDESRAVARSTNHLEVHQRGHYTVAGLPFSYESVRDVSLQPITEIRARTLEGNAGRMESICDLQQRGEQTVVKYRADWTPGSVWQSAIGTGFLKQQLVRQFDAMQQEMLRRKAHSITPASAP